jgi:hypothetical protein
MPPSTQVTDARTCRYRQRTFYSSLQFFFFLAIYHTYQPVPWTFPCDDRIMFGCGKPCPSSSRMGSIIIPFGELGFLAGPYISQSNLSMFQKLSQNLHWTHNLKHHFSIFPLVNSNWIKALIQWEQGPYCQQLVQWWCHWLLDRGEQ